MSRQFPSVQLDQSGTSLISDSNLVVLNVSDTFNQNASPEGILSESCYDVRSGIEVRTPNADAESTLHSRDLEE